MLFFSSAVLLSACRQGAAHKPTALFSPAESSLSCAIDGNPNILRERCVTVNLDLLVGLQAGDTLLLNLFPDTEYIAILDRSQANLTGGIIWSGHLESIENSRVSLVVEGDWLTGNVTLTSAAFQIREFNRPVYGIYHLMQ